MRDFSPVLLEPFGLKARKVTRAYGAFICDTPKGLKILKTTMASSADLWFAHGVKEHMAQAGYGATDRYQVAQTGEPWSQIGSEMYTVRDWAVGEEADLTVPEQCLGIAREMGRIAGTMHGYETLLQTGNSGSPAETMEGRKKQFQRFRRLEKSLRKNGRYTDFDMMVLQCLPEHMEQAQQAEELFDDPAVQREVKTAEEKRTFAHRNFSDHTVIWDKGNTLFTDFERAGYDLPLFDLTAFLEKALRKNHWPIELGAAMIAAYEENFALSEGMRKLLYGQLLFPKRLAQLCAEVYGAKRTWMPLSYSQKLEEICRQQEERKAFLREFEKICL